MAIPSRYVFSPLGGAGSLPTMLGFVFFVLYLLRWLHPSSTVGAFRQPLRLAALAIYCAFTAAYITGSLTKLTTLEQNADDRSLIIISGWVGLLLLVTDAVESIDRLKVLLHRMVLGASALAALGVTQFFTGLDFAKYIIIPGLTANQPYTDISTRGSYNRPSATAIHPIEFGFVLSVILPIAMHQARFAPPERAKWRWFQVVLIAVALPMTVSRSAIIGLALALLFVVPTWSRKERWIALGVIVAGVLAIQVMVPGMIRNLDGLFMSIGSGTDTSTNSRTSAFSSAGPLIAQHPIFGLGFGTFSPAVYFFTDDQYLNSIIELGLVGVLTIAALFITGFFTARRIRKHSLDAETRHLGQCMAASCAIILVGLGTFDAFYFPMAAGTSFLMLGLIGALWRLTTIKRLENQGLPTLI